MSLHPTQAQPHPQRRRATPNHTCPNTLAGGREGPPQLPKHGNPQGGLHGCQEKSTLMRVWASLWQFLKRISLLVCLLSSGAPIRRLRPTVTQACIKGVCPSKSILPSNDTSPGMVVALGSTLPCRLEPARRMHTDFGYLQHVYSGTKSKVL